MHADVFRYVVMVYAFAFVALIVFDTEQRFFNWGNENLVTHNAQPVPVAAPVLKHVTPADVSRPAVSPEPAKDI